MQVYYRPRASIRSRHSHEPGGDVYVRKKGDAMCLQRSTIDCARNAYDR